MVHKPKHKVHSFRGLLADGGQDKINLERQNVNIAYRIVKFALFPGDPPGTTPRDSAVSIWREEQSSVVVGVDFTNTDLLGAGLWFNGTYETDDVVIFDNILFSRNIYVTHFDSIGSGAMNYYIEIEEVPVTASTLMQIKLGTARKLIGAKMGG